MDAESVPQQAQEKIEQVESADLVVGILADFDPDGVAGVCEALGTLAESHRIVVLLNDRVGHPLQASPQMVEKNGSLSLLRWAELGPDVPGSGIDAISSAYQSVFAAGEKLGARACCVIDSKLDAAPPQWVLELARPLLEADFDLVAANYARRKFEGLLNSSILCPLLRSLYGKRVQNPIGPDLGVSRRLFQKMSAANGNVRAGIRMHPLASLAPMAFCANLQVCQVHVGARIYPPTDWTNISSLMAQVLEPIFLDMERNAACWQRVRGSAPVPGFGPPVAVPQESATVDTGRMVNSFQLGVRDLQEIWGLVLPPATLLELRRLSRLAAEQFRMPDELWARIVYDFALAYHLRTINRDHLLRSMTPLYLGWVASYARELQAAGSVAVDQRLESLSLAYEGAKPYLVSRWRWPDRFNP
ncbi:MAG: hypothetical protein ACRD33_05050 [Candidatus Acidiferrales bacterium]